MKLRFAVALATVFLAASSALAQEAASTEPAAGTGAGADSACELHVWPTQNYIGINTGLLAGFGIAGMLADSAMHQGKVHTVKELMAEYLGPDQQVQQLKKLDFTDVLRLKGYKVIYEEPTPFADDLKNDPKLRERAEFIRARIKSKQRLLNTNKPCYAELITTHIFYHKAAMYGSNLFTGWTFREFGDKQLATKVSTGQVKNPLEDFPPKNPEKVESAKLEIRDAYSKDFLEYVQKKVKH